MDSVQRGLASRSYRPGPPIMHPSGSVGPTQSAISCVGRLRGSAETTALLLPRSYRQVERHRRSGCWDGNGRSQKSSVSATVG